MALGVEVLDSLTSLIADVPPGSVVSRMVFNNNRVKVNLLGFAPGEKIVDYMPDSPSIIEVWRGEGLVTLGDEVYEVSQGTWMYIDRKTPHTIEGRSEMLVLVTVLREGD